MLHDKGAVIKKIWIGPGKEITSLRRDTFERASASANRKIKEVIASQRENYPSPL